MITFLVWQSGEEEEDAKSIKSFDSEMAASEYVETNYCNLDYPEYTQVWVKGPNGVKELFDVAVEMIPSFSATRVRKE